MYGLLEELITKWLWSSLGLLICSIPVFFKLPGSVGVVDFGTRTEGWPLSFEGLLFSVN